jgi:DNA topoisomerase VI subunit A
MHAVLLASGCLVSLCRGCASAKYDREGVSLVLGVAFLRQQTHWCYTLPRVSCNRKTAITTRILSLVHELCLKQIHVTKRDLFYTDVKLFEVCCTA